ncbi:MAG: T9SS type A sorting domain-containing protein [Bacteroidota bacterium]
MSEPFVVHWTDETDPAFSGSGGNLLTQTPDTACSMLTVSVTDPTTNPLGTFSPLVVNPQNPDGSELKSLSGLMTFYVRVRSEAEVTLGLVLRSGDGSSLFRTDRIDQIIPASTTNWTELTYTFDANTLGGFDSTDLRDMWFYLDPGTPNFAGEEVVFDYVAVGEKPESLTHSTCIDAPPFVFPWVVHWANPTDPIPNGAGAEALVIETDTICSQLQITIPDPIDTPYPAFSALALIPRDEFGNDIRDISNQLRVSIRARSLQAVDLSILMRSGNGSITERTNLITQTVPAGLGEWTNLSFNFTGSNQAGLDPTDLRDIFLFLDRESPNFPGNEIYMDYVTVGIAPSPAQNSTCVTVPIDDFPSFINRIGPNPLPGGQNLEVSLKTSAGASITLKLLSLTGQVLQKTTLATSSPQTYLNWELPHMPQGLYLLMISSGPQSQLYKLEIRS